MQRVEALEILSEKVQGDDVACRALASIATVQIRDQWKKVDTSLHEKPVILGWYGSDGEWNQEIGMFSRGKRNAIGYSNYSEHSFAIHWIGPPRAAIVMKAGEL